jgi:hypothetical protein
MFSNLRKIIFYYTIIIVLFIGSVSAVFRPDDEAKWVSIGSALLTSVLLVFAFHKVAKDLP